jgi:hypothetical protein
MKSAARRLGIGIGPDGALVLLSRVPASPAGTSRLEAHFRHIHDLVSHPMDGSRDEAFPTIPAIGQRLYFRSSLCTAVDFRHPEFHRWLGVLGETPRLHRKIWEHVFIGTHMEAAGLLQEGRRGLGFGVGKEPLPAAFAARGASVVATDLSPDAAARAGWVKTNQYASQLSQLNPGELCPPEVFARKVKFEECDMNAISPHLRDFDFCWSSCSLEHLGSIQAGLDFIKASIRTLKVGGVAVHTTEYTISSNDETIDNNPTLVIFRRQDIQRIVEELRAEGHLVAEVRYDVLSEPIDLFVDIPPFVADTHLRLTITNYVVTSIGLVIQRGR